MNELRETFHRWIRTLVFPVKNGELGDPRAHVPAQELRATQEVQAPEDRQRAGEILEDVDRAVRRWLRRHSATRYSNSEISLMWRGRNSRATR